ncbi:MAG TPA: hypothetical protein VLE43_05910, partial [Candidatus Saccharimonadia bacterium]|nr:hypothetical protein [Candidatus Saccharimonadia bacterium]
MRDWRGPEVIAGRDGVKRCALHKTPLVPKTTFQRKVPWHIQPLEAWLTAYLRYPNPHMGLLWDAKDQRTSDYTESRTDWYCTE